MNRFALAALFLGVFGLAACDSAPKTEPAVSNELKVVPVKPQQPVVDPKAGIRDPSIRPVNGKGGIPDDSIKPATLNGRTGVPDDSVKPAPKP